MPRQPVVVVDVPDAQPAMHDVEVGDQPAHGDLDPHRLCVESAVEDLRLDVSAVSVPDSASRVLELWDARHSPA